MTAGAHTPNHGFDMRDPNVKYVVPVYFRACWQLHASAVTKKPTC